jgi:hypothetical protein
MMAATVRLFVIPNFPGTRQRSFSFARLWILHELESQLRIDDTAITRDLPSP